MMASCKGLVYVLLVVVFVLNPATAFIPVGAQRAVRSITGSTLYSQDFSAAANPALSGSGSVFNPSALLSGVGLQSGAGLNPASPGTISSSSASSALGGGSGQQGYLQTAANPGGNPQVISNPAGSPQTGSNPSGFVQTGNPAGDPGLGVSNPAGNPQTVSNPAGVVVQSGNPVGSGGQTGNPVGSPHMSSNPAGIPNTDQSGIAGYTQYGNPAGTPVQTSGGHVAAASGIQQIYQANPNRQDYTGQSYNPNNKNYVGSFDPNQLIGKRAPGKRFNPDVTNSELISNPNPVNVGLAFNPAGLSFVPGSSGVSQTGVATSAGTSGSSAIASQTGTFNPNTLPSNQNPAGNFNPANPQTAGSFDPNAGQGFVPSNTQSQTAGNFDPNSFSAGDFDPNSFSAGNFDPNAIPPAKFEGQRGMSSTGSLFDPSNIGIQNFPPNTQG